MKRQIESRSDSDKCDILKLSHTQVLQHRDNRHTTKKTQKKCSYPNCKDTEDPLCPCESTGLCPNFTHTHYSLGGHNSKLLYVSIETRLQQRVHDEHLQK